MGAPRGTAVDIWSLGCLVSTTPGSFSQTPERNCLKILKIMEFVQGIVLFAGEASERGTWTVDDDRLARTIEILGPFPPELLRKGSHIADFFDQDDSRQVCMLIRTMLLTQW